MSRKPEPLLPTVTGIAVINDIHCEVALSVDEQGCIEANFASGTPVVETPYPKWPKQRSVSGTTADDRHFTLRDCVVKNNGLQLGEAQRPFRLSLAAGSASIQRSGAIPARTEFALVNQSLTIRQKVLFDGAEIELRPADPHAGGHTGLEKGQPAWITHWASVATPDEQEIRDADDVVRCLAYTLSMLALERVIVPCYRVLDQDGDIARWEFRRVWWPGHRHHEVYVHDLGQPLSVVGQHPVRQTFQELDLPRYVNYVVEARRDDLYVELGLTCILFALELLGANWLQRAGIKPGGKKLATKLEHIHSKLGCVPKKFTSPWLADRLRNPLMHTGVVSRMTVSEIHAATRELVVMAIDVFFKIFGYERDADRMVAG